MLGHSSGTHDPAPAVASAAKAVKPQARLSGQLHVGHRILAVSDDTGNWQQTKGLGLGQVTQYIRSQPNTAVSLLIQPSEGGATRTITITRQHTMMTPKNG